MSPFLILVLVVISAIPKAASAAPIADESEDGVCSAYHRSTARAVSFIQSGFAAHTQWKLQQQVVAPPELGIAHPLASANDSTPENFASQHSSNSSSTAFVDLAAPVLNASSDGADNSSLQSGMSSSHYADVAAAVVELIPNASRGGQSGTDSTSQAYDESDGKVNASGVVAANSTLLLVRASPASDQSTRPASNESSRPASNESSRPASNESSGPASHASSRPASHASSRPASHESSSPASHESSSPASHGLSRPASDESSSPASQASSLWARFKRAIFGPGADVGRGDQLREEKRLAIKAEDFDLAKKLKGDIETLHEGRSDKNDGKREKGHPSDLYLGLVLFGMFFSKMMAWV